MYNESTILKLMALAKNVGHGTISRYLCDGSSIIGAFDLPQIQDSSEKTSEILVGVCKRYSEVKEDRNYLEGFFWLLKSLARKTNTTEMPKGMDKIIAENPELSQSLKEWYGIKE